MVRPIFKGIKDATEITGDGGSGCIGDGGGGSIGDGGSNGISDGGSAF